MKIWKIVCLAICICVGACSKKASREMAADLVVRHANIHTMEEKLPHATALAVRGDKILWVGEGAEAEKYIGEKARVVDAGGRLLLPGFIDSHFHVGLGNDPNVERINANSLKEIRDQVKVFADKRPDLKWIEMDGWNYSVFPNGTLPTAKDLDGLTGGRPAFLVAYDYHTIWMNKEALKIFGITKATKSVSFSEDVQLDKKTGEPTGILIGFGSTGLSEKAEAVLTRHEVVHSWSALNEQDIPRFKELSVTACMQPRHCAPDITGQWGDATRPKRWKYAWAFRSLRDSGATLAFASDWNVAEMEPEIGMYTALKRKGLDGKPVGGWIPEQTIDH